MRPLTDNIQGAVQKLARANSVSDIAVPLNDGCIDVTPKTQMGAEFAK